MCTVWTGLGTDAQHATSYKSGVGPLIVITSGVGEGYNVDMWQAAGPREISCASLTFAQDGPAPKRHERTATIHPAPPDCGLVPPEPPAIKARADVCKGRTTKQVRTETGLCSGAAFFWLIRNNKEPSPLPSTLTHSHCSH